MSSNLRTGLLASCALATIQLMGASTASAQGYCSVASEPGLSLGCARTLVDASLLNGVLNPANALINPIIGKHDGLIFDSDWIANSASDGQLRFEGSVKFARGLNSSWANTYFGSARTDGGKTTYDVTAFDVRDVNTGHITVELQFDRLTLENTALTLKDGASSTGRQTGDISYLLIGDGKIGRGGALALRNASLTFANDTDLFMAAPGGGTPVIRAETGDNLLKLGNQSKNLNRLSVVVDDGANLTFDGTAITPRTEGNLTVGSGANLIVENGSVVGLLSNVGSSLPQTTVNGGDVKVDGLSSELRLTAPVFNDSTVSLENGGTLRIEQRNGVRSILSFSGDSTLNFGSEQAAVLGADANPQAMILAVGAGTTKITNTGGDNNVGRGLQVDQVRIDGGTLDTTGYSVRDDVTNAWQYLSVENGGTFYDRLAFYRNIDRLIVDGGTLQTNSSFGDFVGAADGIENALFTNSTIDLVSASSAGADSGNVSVGLRSVVLNAQNLAFAGTNQVLVGISPAGECVAGICTPALTRYAGELVANVGGSPTSKLTGFDTVLFVPKAIDTKAGAADYIAGGENGIYTVARANDNPRLTFNVKGFDAAPMTPTTGQLSAAGSDLPANLVYTIVNDPVADDRVDISFVDVTLQNHTHVTTKYTPQFTNKVLVEPDPGSISSIAVTIVPDPITDAGKSWQVVEPQTEQVSTLSVSVKPDSVDSGFQTWEVVEPKSELVTTYSLTVKTDPQTGIKQEIITTTVTEPGGEVIGTDTHTVPLDQTGSKIKVITTTVTEPNGDIAFTDTVTVPLDGPDAGTQVIHQIVTEPNGDQIVTSSVAVPLDKPTGTTNTANYGKLVDKNKGTLAHNGLGRIDTLHPEAYASYMTVALEHSDHLRNMVLLNARGRAAGGDRVEGFTDSGHRVWLDSALMRGDVNPDGDLAGFDYDLGEIVLGADIWSDAQSNVGAYVGYGRYSMDEHRSSLDMSSIAYHIGAYGTHDVSDWSFTGMGGFSWADTDATRVAITGTDSSVHKADYNSRTFEAAVRAEYTGFRPEDAWRIAPEIGVGYAHYRQDSITESGSPDTALTIKEATAQSLVGSIGLNLKGPALAGGLEPLGFLRYEHDFYASRDDVHDINAAFASSPGTTQSFVGTHRGPDAVSIGVGIRSAVNSSVDVTAGVVYTKNTYGDEYGGGLSFTWAF